MPVFIRHAAIIFAAALFLTAPHFIYGYPSGHSALMNVPWQHFFYDQLRDGNFYPRWLTDYPTGFGGPVFYFYAPFPFYLASFLGLIGCPGCSAAQLLSAYHLAIFTLAGIAFYNWCSRFSGRAISLIASLVYVLLPYHYLDVEIRNSLGEAAAFLWLPLIFSALHNLVASERLNVRFIALTAMAYAGLILSHLPSALLATPFMGIYALAFANRRNVIRKMLGLAAAGVTGVALAGIYLFPAVFMRVYLLPDIWVSGAGPHYLPEKWLLLSGAIHKFGMLVYADLAIGTFLALGVGVVLFLMRRYNILPAVPINFEKRRALIAACVSLAVGWFMMSIASRWIWINFDIVRQVQFPWRLGVDVDFWAATALAISLSVIAEAVAAHRKNWSRRLLVAACAAVILVPAAADIAHMARFRELLAAGAWTDPTPAKLTLPEEYHSIWAIRSTAFGQYRTNTEYHEHIAALPEIALARETAPAELLEMTRVGPTAFEISALLNAPAPVTFRQAYFPVWKLTDVSTGRDIALQPSAANGLITAVLPEGRHSLRLSVEPGRPEKIGSATSSIAAFLCLLILVAPAIKSWRRARTHKMPNIGKTIKTIAELNWRRFTKRD